MGDEDGHVEIEPDQGGAFIEEPDMNKENVVPEPESGAVVFSAASEFMALYGWYILLAVIGLLYLKNRYSPRIESWQNQRQEHHDANKYSSTEILDRQEALEKARRRMQDQHEQKVQEYAERQKIKEEEKRKVDIEDWERHQRGDGYKSKSKVEEDYYPGNPTSTNRNTKAKKSLREGFNPMMGGSSGGYRAPSRGSSGGG